MYVNSPSSVTFRLLAPCTQASDTPQVSPPSLTIWHRSCTPSLQRHSPLTADSTFVASCTRGRQRLGNLDASGVDSRHSVAKLVHPSASRLQFKGSRRDYQSLASRTRC